MSSQRESLIADLIKETGLPDAEIRQILNALAMRMNEELRVSSEFELPGVGKLMRVPEISLKTEVRGGLTVAEMESLVQRRSAEVVDDAEVPLRRRDL